MALIIANLAVAFLAPFSSLASSFAFDPLHPHLHSWLTCLFLHDPENILHLLGNLVFLAAVGPLVESEVGPIRFVVVYLLSGLIGVASHWVVALNTGVSSSLIGASAAIAGSVGYCTVRFARRRVPLAPKFQVGVGWLAVVWIALQAVGAFVSLGSGGGTSYVAHIGGFVGGIVLAFVFRAQVAASAEVGRAHMAVMSDRSPAAALAAAEKFLEKHPGDPNALWEKAAALHSLGEREHEAEVLTELVRAGYDVERALDCLAIIGKLHTIPPVERMKLAGRVGEALRRDVFLSVVGEPDAEPERPNAILALAECSNDEERSRLLKELRDKYTYHAATETARAKGLIQ